jgi:hypothetical protein
MDACMYNLQTSTTRGTKGARPPHRAYFFSSAHMSMGRGLRQVAFDRDDAQQEAEIQVASTIRHNNAWLYNGSTTRSLKP